MTNGAGHERPTLFLDWDGTIVDVRPSDYWAYVTALTHGGFESIPEAQFWPLRQARTPLPQLLALTNAEAFMPEFLRIRKQIYECPEALALQPVIPGVVDALRVLHTMYRIHIVTARDNEAGFLEQYASSAVKPFVDAVTCITSESRKDEAKAQFFQSVGFAHGSLVVGDTETDVLAAKRAGLPCIAVLSGIRDEAFLRSLEPAVVLPSVAAIPQWLASSKKF